MCALPFCLLQSWEFARSMLVGFQELILDLGKILPYGSKKLRIILTALAGKTLGILLWKHDFCSSFTTHKWFLIAEVLLSIPDLFFQGWIKKHRCLLKALPCKKILRRQLWQREICFLEGVLRPLNTPDLLWWPPHACLKYPSIQAWLCLQLQNCLEKVITWRKWFSAEFPRKHWTDYGLSEFHFFFLRNYSILYSHFFTHCIYSSLWCVPKTSTG